MYSLKVFLLFGTSVLLFHSIEFTSAKNWAVIVVGLDYYRYTYAYEAMAYKQYNDLVKNGYDPENIIVISPDTAAFNRRNPLPGLIAYAYDKEDFSADTPVNQYENVPIDYSDDNLEMQHFFQILSGETNSNLTALGSGRVVKSGPNDNIFLYMHTIGWNGFFLLFDDILYTDKFIPFIEEMAAAKAFKSMFIFMHASYSGSMFDNYMETDLNIMTYALGGRYNVFSMCHWNKWLKVYTSTCQAFEHFTYMDKAIAKNGAKETVLDLYAGSGLMSYDEEIVHNLYGDFRLLQKPIKEFYGHKMKNSQPLTTAEIVQMKNEIKDQIKHSNTSIIKLLTEDEISDTEKDRVEKSMNKVVIESIKNTKIPRNVVNDESPMEKLPLKKFGCYRSAIETMRSKCLTKESRFLFLKYASRFAKLCSFNVPQEKIVSAIKSAC